MGLTLCSVMEDDIKSTIKQYDFPEGAPGWFGQPEDVAPAFVRDHEGDRSRGMSLLDESLAISSELGMRPLMERVLSKRGILGA